MECVELSQLSEDNESSELSESEIRFNLVYQNGSYFSLSALN